MKNIFKMTAIAALVAASSACTRIETGCTCMNAQAQLKVAEGVANGKVHTVVVPYDFNGIVNAK